MLVLGKNGKLVLPENIRSKLLLEEGDLLDYSLEKKIVLTPHKVHDDSVDENLSIFCFGKLQILQNGENIDLHNKKLEELIAYLICENGEAIYKKKLQRFFGKIPIKN